jgi:hypothetical protein
MPIGRSRATIKNITAEKARARLIPIKKLRSLSMSFNQNGKKAVQKQHMD